MQLLFQERSMIYTDFINLEVQDRGGNNMEIELLIMGE